MYQDHRHSCVLHCIEMATMAIEVYQLLNQSLEALMDVSKPINLHSWLFVLCMICWVLNEIKMKIIL